MRFSIVFRNHDDDNSDEIISFECTCSLLCIIYWKRKRISALLKISRLQSTLYPEIWKAKKLISNLLKPILISVFSVIKVVNFCFISGFERWDERMAKEIVCVMYSVKSCKKYINCFEFLWPAVFGRRFWVFANEFCHCCHFEFYWQKNLRQ